MDQPTFADLEYASKKRKTRREIFLERIDSLVPWDRLEGRIRPFYPKAGRGRRPYELSAMLRIHCVQLFYNLSDPGMEDMLYEVESVRRFVGLRLSDPLPDETTILNFRHLLEEHELGQSLFEEINRHLESQGLRLREGTIVDASIIEAPSSTKNRSGERDPEMRQTKKGNEWHFGMKIHIGADAETGVVHSVTTTPANVHDVTEAHRLLHGGEKRVWCDAGYQGVGKRVENRELGVEWQVAMRPGRRRQLEPGSYEALEERRKTSIRAKFVPQGGQSAGVVLVLVEPALPLEVSGSPKVRVVEADARGDERVPVIRVGASRSPGRVVHRLIVDLETDALHDVTHHLAGACQHRMVLPDDELHLVALLPGIYLNEIIVVFCS